ncbi:agglutinin biogenesis protein MshI [Massilia sp. W12]|uniref:agglutinin biogenesis protein MshI n=1 Tax=Massilia sp. W12 TaxID=3126507 RepID=UPI0030CF646D
MAIGFAADAVRAACIKRIPGHKPKVRLVQTVEFEGGSARPVREARAAALEELTRQLQIERHHCTSLLANGEYQILLLDAPQVQAEELKGALRWRLKDMIDYPVDMATFDLLPLPQDKQGGERAQVFVVAARNTLITEHQNLFVQAKTGLRTIDIPELAQRNLAALVEPQGSALALLSFDDEGGLLTISHGGDLYLTRRIDVRLYTLEHRDSEERAAILERITLELQRSLDHFDRQYHFMNLSRLMLAPLPEAGQSLFNYLASNLYLPVEWLDLQDILDCGHVPSLKDAAMQQRYFQVLGAALRLEEGTD